MVSFPRAAWALSLALVWGLTGCSPAPGVISESVYAQVNEDSRERNYDLAWQEIRALNGSLSRGEIGNLSQQAMVVLSRMERLEQGKASSLAQLLGSLPQASMAVSDAAPSELLELMAAQALALQDEFDRGDFSAARETAFQVYALALMLEGRE